MNLFLPHFLKKLLQRFCLQQAIQIRLERDLGKTEDILHQDTQSPVRVAEGRNSVVV